MRHYSSDLQVLIGVDFSQKVITSKHRRFHCGNEEKINPVESLHFPAGFVSVRRSTAGFTVVVCIRISPALFSKRVKYNLILLTN